MRWKSALDDFAENGVSTEFVDFDDKSHPAEATIVLTGDGERFIVYNDEPLHHIKLPSAAKVAQAISLAQLLMVDAGICPPGTLDVIKKCSELKIPVVLDAEQFFVEKSLLLEMISFASDPILPLNFAKAVTGKEYAAEVVNWLWNQRRNAVVITDGANGCYFQIKGESKVQHINAYVIEAIDTNGTGDIFHGAYAYGILKGMDPIETLRFASAAAASVAVLPHGADRRPNLKSIEEFMSQHPALVISGL